MNEDDRRIRFFLGSNSPYGFVSRFNTLYDPQDGWRAFLIKGGPGTGKSGLMKRIAQTVADAGFRVEYVYCSSDPDSLDAVIVPELKICLADATAPHVIEPKFPGAVETLVHLGDFWDPSKLYDNREEVIELTKSCSAVHEQAGRFLSAAGSLIHDTRRYALECTDLSKVARYASRLARRELGGMAEKSGKESVRLLSAVTMHGVLFFEETVAAMCPRVFVLEDEYGAVASLLMAHLRTHALAAGHDIITCYCSMSPHDKPEQILIPSLGIAFVTSNSWHPYRETPYRRIHVQRFLDMPALREHKQRISFNKRAARELIAQASSLMLSAKAMHDELESYYISAMDFEKVDAKGNEIAQRILSCGTPQSGEEK
ncbi:MAG: hypothetical protein HFE85_04940 [Clostridiales bacterium]|nr:hypothetical protein [Clostridiales bacterium]